MIAMYFDEHNPLRFQVRYDDYRVSMSYHTSRVKEGFMSDYLDEWPTLAWKCGFGVVPESLYTLATGKPVFEAAITPPVHRVPA
jgi:hypothetical protein